MIIRQLKNLYQEKLIVDSLPPKTYRARVFIDKNNNGVWDCEEIIGCTDIVACNYNETTNVDDGSCEYADGCDYCSGEIDGSGVVVDGDLDSDDICDIDEIAGCTNPNACNYCEDCTDDDGSCESLSCVGCLDDSVDENGNYLQCDYDYGQRSVWPSSTYDFTLYYRFVPVIPVE